MMEDKIYFSKGTICCSQLCNFLRCWAKQLQYQAVVHPDIFLSMVHLQKLASHWRDAEFLLHLRKYRHCCVSFAVERDKLLVIFLSELEALDNLHFSGIDKGRDVYSSPLQWYLSQLPRESEVPFLIQFSQNVTMHNYS